MVSTSVDLTKVKWKISAHRYRVSTPLWHFVWGTWESVDIGICWGPGPNPPKILRDDCIVFLMIKISPQIASDCRDIVPQLFKIEAQRWCHFFCPLRESHHRAKLSIIWATLWTWSSSFRRLSRFLYDVARLHYPGADAELQFPLGNLETSSDFSVSNHRAIPS